MEGLIPMAYKAIKRSRTRNQYQRLSSNIAGLYASGDAFVKPRPGKVSRFDGFWRQDKRIGGGAPPPGKPLVRFRSHKLFSCVTGA